MLEKIMELKIKGFDDEDVMKNIFLNYSSKYENDSIYLIKKELAEFLNVEINSIKLIGSAHSGISKTKDKIVPKENPNDLDFTVIDTHCFARELENIIRKKEIKTNKKNLLVFNKNITNGKIHLKYVKKKNKISKFCDEISRKNLIDKKISVCIYLSEFYFIKSLINFYGDSFLVEDLKKYVKKDIEKTSKLEIKRLDSFK